MIHGSGYNLINFLVLVKWLVVDQTYTRTAESKLFFITRLITRGKQ